MNIQPKHTKGPWRIEGQEIRVSDSVHTRGHLRNSIGISNASYSDLVCTINGNVCQPIDALDPIAPLANAHLIAAAPEMLSELKKQRDWCQHFIGTTSQGEFRDSLRIGLEQSIKAIDAVISKSEGNA